MAELVDKSGQLVQVDDAQAGQLIAGGELGLRGDRPANLIDTHGNVINVDAPDAVELLKGGTYRLASDAEVAADLERQKYQGFGQGAAAVVEGVARGATMGLSDVAAKELAPEYAEGVAGRLKHRATEGLVGEGLGVLGATLLTGGAAAEAQGVRGALGGAARLATAPTRAAVAAGEALTGGLATRLGAETAGSLLTRAAAKGGAGAAGQSLEGALFGAAKVATDDYLTDHEITVDRIATGAGLGALMGGAFGGLTGTGGTLLEAGARKAASPLLAALKRQGDGLEDTLTRFADQRAYKAALGGRNVREVRNAKRYGGPEEIGRTLIEEMGPEQLARATVEDIANFATQRSDELGKQIGRMTDEIQASGSAVKPDGRALKQRIQEEILSPLRKHFSQDAAAVEREFADFLEVLDPASMAPTMRVPRARSSTGVGDDTMGGLMGSPGAKVTRGALGEEITESVADAAAHAPRVPTARQGAAAGDDMGGLMGSKAAPELSFAELNDWRKAIGNRIDWKVMDGTPKAVLEAKQDLYRLVGDYWKETAEQAAESVGRPGFRAELETLNRKYSQLEHVEKIAKQAMDRDQSNRFFSASDYGIGAALTGASAIMDGGLASLVYGLAGGALHKVLRERGSAMLSGAIYSLRGAPKMVKDARTGEEVLERSVSGLIARMNDRAKKAGQAVTRGARAAKQSTAPILGLSVSTPREVAPLLERVRELQDPNSERRQRFAQNLAPIRVVDPRMAAAMESKVQRTADYLAEKAKGVVREPAAGDVWGRLRDKPVDTAAAARFMAIARAAEDPQTVFNAVEDGTVTKDQVDTLRALSPRLYQRMVTQIMSQLGDVTVLPTYEDRIKLGIVLGAPTDPSLEPKNVARLQALAKRGAQHGSELSGPPPSSRTPPKVADQYATSTQAILGMSGIK